MKQLFQNKILILSLSVFFIVFILVYGFIINKNDNYESIKIDANEYLVYTSEKLEEEHYSQYKPYINIKGELVEAINHNIDEYYQYFYRENISIRYDYNVSGSILSLIIKVEDASYVESAKIYYFQAYHLNLDTLELLEDSDILELFHITQADADAIVGNQLLEYYNTLVNQDYIHSRDCDYECFLSNREPIDPSLKAQYFIKDGKLFLYVPNVFIPYYPTEEAKSEFEIIASDNR